MTLIDRIKTLRIGKSFRIATKSERIQVLNAARILGIRLTTRESKRGGFTVTRLPE